MAKIYKWALIATALAAIAYTCFSTFSKQTALASVDASVETIINPKTKKTPEDRARFAEERAKFEYDMLKDPKTGKIPEGMKERAKKQALRAPELRQQVKGTGFTVTPRGPNNFGGRTRAIAIDVSDNTNNTIIAGGVSSGVFRTTNGGTSWTKVSSNDEIHNVTAIAQDPRAGFQNIWYYGTGEALGNSASLGSGAFNLGHGVWKSVNGGVSWTRLPNSSPGALESFQCADLIFRMAIDPTNGNVYAAIPNAILRSTDGGATWSTVLGSGCSRSDRGETDIIISSTGTVYVGRAGDSGSANDGVWTSPTGNAGSFTRIAGNSSPAGWNAPGSYDRIVLALAPSDEDILYALYENNVNSSCSGTAAAEADLWVYDASGPSWTDRSANMPDETGCLDGNDPFAVQGGYDLCVAVKPDDPNTVFIGGTNVYRSTDGFATTGNTTRIGGYVSANSYGLYLNHHPDIHFLTFATGGNGTFDEDDMLFTGTDGGVHRGDITDATVAWTSLNNDYVTYQYYHAAIDPTIASNTIMGGTQDNGTTQTTAGTTHSRIRGGDGVAVGIATDGTKYFGTQLGRLHRGEGPQTLITPSGSSSIFVTYFLLDPDNTEYLYYAGRDTLYRTSSASTVTTSTWDKMATFTTGDIRSMATSRGAGYGATDANRKLYIGTSNGEVYRLNDPAFTATTNTPVEITPGSAGSGIVSSISVNPLDDNEILVTYSNFNTNSVYHTTNANSNNPTWTNVEGNIGLSSFRSSTIIEAGGVVYYLVGTSVGLYCTQTLSGGTTTWTRVGPTSIGYAIVSQLALRPVDNFFVAGTHGNGLFMVQAPSVPSIAFASVSSSTTEATTATTSCRDYTDITVSMVITQAPTGDAIATLTTSGTAVEGVDYDILNPSNQLTFADGLTTAQDVTIRVYDDSNPESAETLILDFTVSGTTDAIKASSNITHTLTLSDNDFPPGSTVTIWEEDFEGGITYGGFADPDWVRGGFGGTPFTSSWRNGGGGAMSGTQSAYVSSDGGASASYNTSVAEDIFLRTEQIDATAYSDLTLSFDFKANGDAGNDYGQLLYSLDGISFFVFDGTTTAPYVGVTGSTNRVVALPPALNNQTFYLGFRWIHNADGAGGVPPFTIDNISVTAPFSPSVETVLNSTDEQYFGPFETVHFYDGNDLVMTLQNNSSYDYGCTSVTIDREGISAEAAWSAVSGEELASKTFLVTPTNNTPPGAATYDIILYYSQAEMTGWIANSDPLHTTADFKIVKSTGAISSLGIGSTNAEVNVATNYAAYGSDHSFTATFDGGFSGFGGGDPSNPVLPVEYSSFTGEQVESQVRLDWSTSLELNSDRFEIERSREGVEFEKIGEVASTGGENGKAYQFFDQTPNLGKNIYRLRQVDIDGAFSYSSTVEVSFDGNISYNLYPNPFTESFYLSIAAEGSNSMELSLFDLTGKKVHQQEITFTDRVRQEIRLPDLAPGTYLYVVNQGGFYGSGKIVKN